MRFLWLLLLSFPVLAKDRAIGNNFLYTFDTEGNQIIQETISGWFHKQNFGVGYTHSWYFNQEEEFEYNYNGSAISLLSNFKYKDFSMVGTAGLAQLNKWESPYFIGDMNFNYHYNKNMILSLATYGDVVNSTNAMQEQIVFNGYALTIDYYNKYGGMAANIGQMYFSDGNVRDMVNLKIFADIRDGLNIYLRTRQYGDSEPNNGIYWSPEMYSRYGLGIGFRQRFYDILFSGFVEGGASYANQEWLPATTWRLNAEKNFDKSNWTANIAIGSDINGSDNYKFWYVNANIKYSF